MAETVDQGLVCCSRCGEADLTEYNCGGNDVSYVRCKVCGNAQFGCDLEAARKGWSERNGPALPYQFAAGREQGLREAAEVARGRKRVYEGLARKSDPLGDDDSNRHERMRHTVEAHDHLIDAIEALSEKPA